MVGARQVEAKRALLGADPSAGPSIYQCTISAVDTDTTVSCQRLDKEGDLVGDVLTPLKPVGLKITVGDAMIDATMDGVEIVMPLIVANKVADTFDFRTDSLDAKDFWTDGVHSFDFQLMSELNLINGDMGYFDCSSDETGGFFTIDFVGEIKWYQHDL